MYLYLGAIPGFVVTCSVRMRGDNAKPSDKSFNYKDCLDVLFRVCYMLHPFFNFMVFTSHFHSFAPFFPQYLYFCIYMYLVIWFISVLIGSGVQKLVYILEYIRIKLLFPQSLATLYC